MFCFQYSYFSRLSASRRLSPHQGQPSPARSNRYRQTNSRRSRRDAQEQCLHRSATLVFNQLASPLRPLSSGVVPESMPDSAVNATARRHAAVRALRRTVAFRLQHLETSTLAKRRSNATPIVEAQDSHLLGHLRLLAVPLPGVCIDSRRPWATSTGHWSRVSHSEPWNRCAALGCVFVLEASPSRLAVRLCRSGRHSRRRLKDARTACHPLVCVSPLRLAGSSARLLGAACSRPVLEDRQGTRLEHRHRIGEAPSCSVERTSSGLRRTPPDAASSNLGVHAPPTSSTR